MNINKQIKKWAEEGFKFSGKTQRGKRDGTGPFEGSFQERTKGVGKRKETGEECPFEEEKEDKKKKKKKTKKAQVSDPTYDPQNIDPETGNPYGTPSLEDKVPEEYFTERKTNRLDDSRLQEIAEKAFQANREKDYARYRHWMTGLSNEEKRIVHSKMKQLSEQYRKPFEPFH